MKINFANRSPIFFSNHVLIRSMIFLVLAYECGCTTLAVNIPMPSVSSPEVRGTSGRLSIESGLIDSQQVDFTDSANARPPDFSSRHIVHAVILPVGLAVGIMDRAQVQGNVSALLGSAWLLAQYQLIGEPSSTATEGNFALALQLMGGGAWTTASGDQQVTFGPGGFPWHGSADASFFGPGVSLGYRFNEALLMYGGFAFNWYRGHSSIVQNASKDGASVGGTYTYDSDGIASDVTLALQWGRKFSFTPEASYATSQFKGFPVTVDLRLLGRIGLQF